jgi:hypothetical protein
MEQGAFQSFNDTPSEASASAPPPLKAADFGIYTPRHGSSNLKNAVDEMTGTMSESSPAAQKSDNDNKAAFGDKVALEGKLLGSLPSHLGDGIAESARDAYEHLGRSTFETISGVAIGAAFTLLSKNPRPLIAASMTWAGRAFVGIAAVDLGSRFARPMADVWASPGNLEVDKKQLGNNVGDAVFNYALAVGGGVAGARIGEKYLATTRLGTVLQGFKETEVSADQLQKALGQGKETAVGAVARAFVRDSGAKSPHDLPFDGPIRLRELSNGTHIGSTRDGSIIVTTADGTALSFKNNRSFFGLKNNIELTKIMHKGGDDTDILTGIYSPTRAFTPGADSQVDSHTEHFIGKDYSSYFSENSPRVTTSDYGKVRAVEAGGVRMTNTEGTGWKLNMTSQPNHAAVYKFSDTVGSFSLSSITDRFRSLKRGAEAGLSEAMLERAGDIGSSIFEHEVLVRSGQPPAEASTKESGTELAAPKDEPLKAPVKDGRDKPV